MKLKPVKITRNLMLCIFIWIYICLNSMILFRNSDIRYAANFLTMACIVAFAGRLKLYDSTKMIMAMYLLLLSTTALGAGFQQDAYGFVQLCKVLLYFMLLFFVLSTSEHRQKTIETYMNIYLFISILISLQCIVLFFLVWFNCVEPKQIYYETIGGNKQSFGILGYGDAINYFGNSQFLRTTSFFREPSKLGIFLIAPILWTYAKYRETREKKYLIYEGLLMFNFLATFSRAGYLAFAIGCASLFVFHTAFDKRKYEITPTKKMYATILVLCGAICFIVLGRFLYQFTQSEAEMYDKANSYENNAIMGMINRSSAMESRYGNAFIRDDSNFETIFKKISESPLGYGLGWSGREQEFNNPTALGFWVYSGGYPAIIMIALIYVVLFYKYCLACMYSGDLKMRMLGASFISITIQNMSYGSWAEPYYLLVISLMVLAVETKKRELNEACVHEKICAASS